MSTGRFRAVRCLRLCFLGGEGAHSAWGAFALGDGEVVSTDRFKLRASFFQLGDPLDLGAMPTPIPGVVLGHRAPRWHAWKFLRSSCQRGGPPGRASTLQSGNAFVPAGKARGFRESSASLRPPLATPIRGPALWGASPGHTRLGPAPLLQYAPLCVSAPPPPSCPPYWHSSGLFSQVSAPVIEPAGSKAPDLRPGIRGAPWARRLDLRSPACA